MVSSISTAASSSVLHRYGAKSDETIRRTRYEHSDSVVDGAGSLDSDFKRNGVIALRRRRHHDLPIDAHVVQIPQALGKTVFETAQAGVALNLLLLVDLVVLGICTERQRRLEISRCGATRAATDGTDTCA